ncbi:hypothetical protein ACZ90_70690 [Streptomyces albus subsp. albus]|uniref:hypothetical protein n=1 Tax=Streptomyces TaxID=1883 RepID=UPI00074A8484|nr:MULTISPECIES: hypothetical protein [Streptomyces]KUJ35964.1 hypothetical protein ACZ90_70690 [Streptomyces albus subsp. albus]
MPGSPLDAAVAYFENQYVNQFFGHEVAAKLRALATEAPAPADRTMLTEIERQLLTFALELAEEEIHARSLEIPDKDRAALTSLRRLADDTTTQEPPR